MGAKKPTKREGIPVKHLRFALLALVSACAYTPAELRQIQPTVTFDMAKAPREAAECLGRGAEEYPKLLAIDQFSATWREGPKPDAYEVVVRRVASVPLLVADIAPNGTGSRVTVWQSHALMFDADLGVEMGKRCEAANLVIHDPQLADSVRHKASQ